MLDLDEIAGRHEGGLCGCEKEDSEGRMPACDAAVAVGEVRRLRQELSDMELEIKAMGETDD